MIDREMSELFPPIWAAASGASTFVFPWVDAPVSGRPSALLANATGRGRAVYLDGSPTLGGSFVAASDEGVVLHLGAADARSMDGGVFALAVWPDAQPMSCEPEQTALLVVSDWASAESGNA